VVTLLQLTEKFSLFGSFHTCSTSVSVFLFRISVFLARKDRFHKTKAERYWGDEARSSSKRKLETKLRWAFAEFQWHLVCPIRNTALTQPILCPVCI
jgi:hypothetical protein